MLDLLSVRCAGRHEGWVFQAKRAKSGHLTTVDRQFRKARREAGLPENVKLYCGRHDFGMKLLERTGNLALVMKVMGHTDPRIAMRYQHPELEQVRQAINMNSNNQQVVATGAVKNHGTLYGTPKTAMSVSD